MDFKILYVEDNPINMLLIRKMLNVTDYQLIEAMDGLSGYDAALHMQPDLIITDIGLPDISGIELVRRIKQTPALRHIPIIALTADVSENTSEACLEAGCTRVIHKPVSRFALLDAIRVHAQNGTTTPIHYEKPERHSLLTKTKVLIAEDNRDLRDIFAFTFDRRHFAVRVAEDGLQALEMLKTDIPDVLVLDVNMPYMTGLDVLTYVRQNARMKHVKVIVVTGNCMSTLAPEAEQADLFLVKPVNIADLVTFAQRLVDVPA